MGFLSKASRPNMRVLCICIALLERVLDVGGCLSFGVLLWDHLYKALLSGRPCGQPPLLTTPRESYQHESWGYLKGTAEEFYCNANRVHV